MKLGLLICILCFGAVVARPDQPQTDEDDGMEVLRMVESLGHSMQEVAEQEDGWLARYQQVAEMMKENNGMSEELLSISRTAVPIIWNTFMGKTMIGVLKQIEKGGVLSPYTETLPPPPPKFIFVYPSPLTVDDKFTVQAVVRTTAEANIGFCLYFEPEEGEELDIDNGDIFFASHIRWHFDYGNSREIVFNDRYNGVWSRPEMAVGGDQWPDFEVGEKFIISVMKHPRTVDPRKLTLTVNEDKRGAGEVIVHWLTWFPMN
ncbi:hypothetical protein GWK47_020573 [Chionoecetes opilio]|uniref:Galectin domain-containing protein n=1 Tax=Chionoecetes opilio TaxID=41210 RepID=A0A8J4XPK8_CHIOP|nr:hypothetical protein GWK47_020573 [Chionoecetes opilio]